MADKNFEYLGNQFQLQLLNQLIVDKDFAHSIVEVLEPSYFENKYFKLIVQMVKEYYQKFEHSPSFDTLNQVAKSEIAQELLLKITLDTISDIKNVDESGTQFVQEKALKFCKQQELQKVMDKAKKIIDHGEFENYDTLEEMVREALQVGNVDRGTGDVFENLEDVLADDYRHPIPMGIPGIDNLLKGGLAKGEIGVILAPTGVGKSTLTTKIANNAFNLGFNVLQILLISMLRALHLSNIQNQSKFAELYPPMILGLSSSIILKNSTRPLRSESSSGHSITFLNPLLVFIPIIKIRPSLGSNEVVSKSNPNLVRSLYSSNPLNNLFSREIK